MDLKDLYQDILKSTYKQLEYIKTEPLSYQTILKMYENKEYYDSDTKFKISIESFGYAANSEDLGLLKYIENISGGYSYNYDYGIVYWSALESASEKMLEYVINNRYNTNVCYNKSAQFAIRGGNLDFFKSIYHTGNKWYDKTSMGVNIFIKDALEHGHLHILKYLFENKIYDFKKDWWYFDLQHLIKLALNHTTITPKKIECFYYVLKEFIKILDNSKKDLYGYVNLKKLRIDENDLPLLELDNLENINLLKSKYFILPENIKKLII